MNFKDFIPHVVRVEHRFLDMKFPEDTFESFDACVLAAREWIDREHVEVINLETVVLPNMYDPDQTGSIDTDLVSSKESKTHWYQFLRVWYR